MNNFAAPGDGPFDLHNKVIRAILGTIPGDLAAAPGDGPYQLHDKKVIAWGRR